MRKIYADNNPKNVSSVRISRLTITKLRKCENSLSETNEQIILRLIDFYENYQRRLAERKKLKQLEQK